MVRLIMALGFLVSGLFLLVGLFTAYDFEKDPFAYADSVCPEPPNGVDSHERQQCLADYEKMTGLDVAGSSFVTAACAFGVAVIGYILGPDTGFLSPQRQDEVEPPRTP